MNKTKKYTISLNGLTGDTFSINIPMSTSTDFAGRREIIEDEFVTKEISKAINGVEDYEQKRFTPMANEITYILKDKNGQNIKFVDLGFNTEDIKFNRNRFAKSFLELVFFDDDDVTKQNRLFSITLFPSLTLDDIKDDNIINNLDAKLVVTSPYTDQLGQSEGYYLYDFKDKYKNNTNPVKIYMEATFNNAKTGKPLNLMTKASVSNISEVVKNIFTTYQLDVVNKRYEYDILTNQGNVVNNTSAKTSVISLYPRTII